MTKIITLYNNIGGVSKTTTLFNIASFISKTSKVLIADCDPRCSITGLFFAKNFDDPQAKFEGTSLYEALKPRFDGQTKVIEPSSVNLARSTKYDNLFLLRGDMDFYLAEGVFARAWINAKTANTYVKNNYVVLTRLLRDIGEYHKFDYILCDVGACPGYTTRLVLLSCDKYLVPLIPDRFNNDSVILLQVLIERWIDLHKENLQTIENAYEIGFPNAPVFFGGIMHHLKSETSRTDEKWTRDIEKNLAIFAKKVPSLSPKLWIDPIIAKMDYLGPIPSVAQLLGLAIFDINEEKFYDIEEKIFNGKKHVSGNWNLYLHRIKKYEDSIRKLAEALE